MSELNSNLDFEVLQAKWILGGVDPEQVVQAAVSALQRGFDGKALQQLAGLSDPTKIDLGTLPDRAFAEMGLKAINQDEAISFLLGRGEPPTCPVISILRRAFPEFSDRWRKHVASWGGNCAGSYIDMSQFVHFAVEDLYEKGNLVEVRRLFQILEDQLDGADEETDTLIALGFFETLQCFASWRPVGNSTYEQFLGPKSKGIWDELKIVWAGKSSLMDVLRAETKIAETGES